MALGFGMGFPRNEPFAGGPSLNLQFVGNTVLSPSITFTRALNTATYFDATGTLQTASANTPRFDYNPSTLAAQGLLIEESRTNSIRNNTMQGAVAGTPGTAPTNWAGSNSPSNGVSRQIIGTGTENGITYIDIRFSGTTTATLFFVLRFETTTQIVAANGQTWTSTLYARLLAGSFANITQVNHVIQYNDVGGAALTYGVGGIEPTTAALNSQRFIRTATASNASTAFVVSYLQIEANSGVAIDITLRIGLPQLELGAFATSVIQTTGTAATRNADVASVNTLTPWFNSAASTIFAEYTISTARTSDPTFARIDDGSDANRLQVSTGASFTVFNSFVIASNVSQGGNTVSVSPLGTHKTAFAVTTNDSVNSADGVVGSSDTTVTIPSGLNRLSLGNNNNSSAFINGWLRRITYYPRRLSNAELQAITS